jgi:hypothetical protein
MTQLTMLPGFDETKPLPSGFAYLMTDGMLIKVGYTGRRDVKQRSGELRATLLCFWSGTKDDERRLHAQLKPWHAGGEWCRLPDTTPMLSFLRGLVKKHGGEPGLQVLDWVIVNNLRRAA